MPRFAGHYQLRAPRDLGPYRLDGTAVLRRQIELARVAGRGGFIFHFCVFNGHRLLEHPLEAFLADGRIRRPGGRCGWWRSNAPRRPYRSS